MTKAAPLTFRCAKSHGFDLRKHDIQRTGRTKPRRPGRLNRGMLDTQHEYVCSCGHRGWSAHGQIITKPLWTTSDCPSCKGQGYIEDGNGGGGRCEDCGGGAAEFGSSAADHLQGGTDG